MPERLRRGVPVAVARQFEIDDRQIPQFPGRQPRIWMSEELGEGMRRRERLTVVIVCAGDAVEIGLMPSDFLSDGVHSCINPRGVMPKLFDVIVAPPSCWPGQRRPGKQAGDS